MQPGKMGRRNPSKGTVTSAADTLKKVEEPSAQLNVRVSPELRHKLRMIAAQDEVTLIEIVTAALNDYVERKGY